MSSASTLDTKYGVSLKEEVPPGPDPTKSGGQTASDASRSASATAAAVKHVCDAAALAELQRKLSLMSAQQEEARAAFQVRQANERDAAVAEWIAQEAEKLFQKHFQARDTEFKLRQDAKAAELKKEQDDLLTEILAMRDDVRELKTEISELQKLRARTQSAVALENVSLRRQLASLPNIWCIRVGDSQGGPRDECYHVRADNEEQVHEYRRNRYRWNAGVTDFEFVDIRKSPSEVASSEDDDPTPPSEDTDENDHGNQDEADP